MHFNQDHTPNQLSGLKGFWLVIRIRCYYSLKLAAMAGQQKKISRHDSDDSDVQFVAPSNSFKPPVSQLQKQLVNSIHDGHQQPENGHEDLRFFLQEIQKICLLRGV